MRHLLPVLAGLPQPAHATLVVFHSAVLPYVEPGRRREFVAAVGRLDAVWLSNEAPGVLGDLVDEPAPPPGTDAFVLVRDGRSALAFTDGHGTWIDRLPGQPGEPG